MEGKNQQINRIKYNMKITTIKTLFIIFVFAICSCKQVADTSIENSVNHINDKCPIELGDNDMLIKAQYRSPSICFYITEKDDNGMFNEITKEQKEQIENSQEFKAILMGLCFNNDVVKQELNNITNLMVNEVGLSFKFFFKWSSSKEILHTEVTYNEIQDMASYPHDW